MDDLDAYGTTRASRLTPNVPAGQRLAHADLHNHTTLSDGRGDPERVFASLREAGLDVAAVTDHAVLASALGRRMALPLNRLTGLDRRNWDRVRGLADAADEAGSFVALRGFEWSSPFRGHLNVWGTEDYSDPLKDLGLTLRPLYGWLASPAGRAGLASFNHPGGRLDVFVLGGFRLQPSAVEQLVALEVFNGTEDYVGRLSGRGKRSPLCRCLDAGWRPGLTGVTDEHGTDWGRPVGKGRTGVWVDELTRPGVLAALQARRVFATRERGVRLDATLADVRMGSPLRPSGSGLLRVDVSLPAPRRLQLQLLGTGEQLPTRLLIADVELPAGVVELPVPDDLLDPARQRWLVLRVADPTRDEPGLPAGWGASIAYSSPWFLDS